MMRIAILGASGFIGGRAVEMLHLEQRCEVRPVVRRASGLARAARFALEGRIADARDEAALVEAFAGCDVVLHAVAGDLATIVGSVAPVYAAAERAGVSRLVYVSSASVHGQAPEPGTDERSPLRERQPIAYNTAKVRAERALLRLRRTGSVEVVILRPGIVYGPRSYWSTSFADDLLAGRAYMVGDGGGVCNAIYVDNLVHAVYLAATAPAAAVDGEAFLVGDRETITWAELYRPIAEALGFSLDDDVARIAYRGAASERTDWWARLNATKDTGLGRRVLDRFPARLRYAVYSALGAWHDYPARERPPLAARPTATLEMALLHGCRYRLPSTRAEAVLGYAPPVGFAEACRRTVGWLAFAGYPVLAPEALDGEAAAVLATRARAS